MAGHPTPRPPLGVVRSALLLLSTMTFTTLVQAHPSVVLNAPALGSVTSCASLLASWSVISINTDASVQTAINSTRIGIWASNVGVDQTAIQSAPAIPRRRRRSLLSTRQQVVAAPVTANVTTQAIPLINGTPSGGRYTWTPVKLPPSQYYVMYLRSLPGAAGGLDVSAQSEKFFVSEGASQSCLAGIVQSITITSTAADSASSAGPTSTPENNTTPSSSKKNHTGAIVGGVIGGLILLGLLLFLLLFCLRRRKTEDKQDLGDFLASRGVNPYGRRSLATSIERRTSSYDNNKYGGILAAIGISSLASEKGSSQAPIDRRNSGTYYPRRFSYQRQPDDYTTDGTTFSDGKRSSMSKFRAHDVTDMATILATDPADEKVPRKSKSSSITTFAQSAVGVPYHPYNAHGDHEDAGDVGVGVGVGRRASQKARRHSAMRGSEGYAMSPFGNRTVSPQEDDEPEVIAWTGPSYKRASTAMSGGDLPRSSEGGELGALAEDQQQEEQDTGAPLARKKSGAASQKTPSSRASVTRKKAPELPVDEDSGLAPPPSAYFPPSNQSSSHHGGSTTTVNTGASAYVPSQATRDRRSADLVAYASAGSGRRSSEVFGPGTSAPAQGGAFDAFMGAKDGPVHLLMPDMPGHAR